MIVVKVSAADILIEGHAGYAENGKDIVCAAVSVLAQTLISAIESLTKDKIYYVIRDGYIHIEFKNLSEHGKLLVDSFFIGICRVQEMYSVERYTIFGGSFKLKNFINTKYTTEFNMSSARDILWVWQKQFVKTGQILS